MCDDGSKIFHTYRYMELILDVKLVEVVSIDCNGCFQWLFESLCSISQRLVISKSESGSNYDSTI